MKHTAPESMKFRRLQRRLACSKLECVGLLELLWITTQKNAMAGDIGRFSNEEIAVEVEWPGDPDNLVEALVETGWLDRSDQYRLVVHDWHDHAPKYVRANLAGRKIPFASGPPKATRSKRPALSDPLKATRSKQGGNLTQPNPTQPNPTQEAARSERSAGGGCVSFDEFVKEYPANDDGRKTGLTVAEAIWDDLTDPERSEAIEAARNYHCAVRANGRKVRGVDSFLAVDWWREWTGQPERPGSLPEPKTAGEITGKQARYELIKRLKIPEARDWDDAKCLHQFVARMAGCENEPPTRS